MMKTTVMLNGMIQMLDLLSHDCEVFIRVKLNNGELFETALTNVSSSSEDDRVILSNIGDKLPGNGSFQDRVKPWLQECFTDAVLSDKVERNYRFLEEALELVQAIGCGKEEALKMVDYVYDRPVGEPYQEVGGVMVTLAALCIANGLDMHQNAETELVRIWNNIDKIKAKQLAKEISGITSINNGKG